jgi:putative N6-adenine-specific DNA methylase
MCGSGTLLLEAGLWAARRAPGLAREDFGFERWADFDEIAQKTIEGLRDEARAAARPLDSSLIGSDTDVKALEAAKANAAQAGLRVSLRLAPASSAMPSADRGGLVVNPPYGERLGRTSTLGSELGTLLRRFEGYERAAILPRHFDVPLRADRFLLVFNGAIECELRQWTGTSSVTP